MNEDKIIFRCEHCGEEYDDELSLNLSRSNQRAFLLKNGCYTVDSLCLSCENQINLKFDGPTSLQIHRALYDEGNFDYTDPDEYEQHEQIIRRIQAELNGTIAPEPEQDEADVNSKIEIFKNEIVSIDKNLDEIDRIPKIKEALKLLIDVPLLYREPCLKLIKDEFNCNERYLEPLRKELNAIIKEAEINKERERYLQIKEKFSQKPEPLTEDKKLVALKYLRNPNLIGKGGEKMRRVAVENCDTQFIDKQLVFILSRSPF